MQKVERLSYFSFYVADYLLDTAELTLTEHGAYCILMFRYYWDGALAQSDIYRACRTPEDRAAVDTVIARYFHLEGERFVHNRIERELEKIGRYVEHQSKAGVASGQARAAKRAAIPAKHAAKPNGQDFTLPDWIDAERWRAWIAVRPARARTTHAQQAALGQLEKMRAKGLDANEIVERSLANGWQGLFAPDQKRGAQAPATSERPSIKCAVCGQRSYTWTGDKCDNCWRSEQGLT